MKSRQDLAQIFTSTNEMLHFDQERDMIFTSGIPKHLFGGLPTLAIHNRWALRADATKSNSSQVESLV